MAPPKISIRADVIDIRHDVPKSEDAFFVDTNAWIWTTYTRVPPGNRNASLYSNYIATARKAGSWLCHTGLVLSEVCSVIEDIEWKFHGGSPTTFSKKEFRHNHPVHRSTVIAEVEVSWSQIQAMSNFVDMTVNNADSLSFISLMKASECDGYDAYHIDLFKKHSIVCILSDDGDFASVPGIKLFTANGNVINAAKRAGKFVNR